MHRYIYCIYRLGTCPNWCRHTKTPAILSAAGFCQVFVDVVTFWMLHDVLKVCVPAVFGEGWRCWRLDHMTFGRHQSLCEIVLHSPTLFTCWLDSNFFVYLGLLPHVFICMGIYIYILVIHVNFLFATLFAISSRSKLCLQPQDGRVELGNNYYGL